MATDPLDEPILSGTLVPVRDMRFIELVEVSKEEYDQVIYEVQNISWGDLLSLRVGDIVKRPFPKDIGDELRHVALYEITSIG